MSDPCMHEDDFKRLESMIEKVFAKMDLFLSDMRDVLVSEATRQEKIIALERDMDQLGASYRRAKDRIDTLNDWRQRFEGAVKVMLAIPVFCTILTTAFAIHEIIK